MFGCSCFPCPSRTIALTGTGIVCVCVRETGCPMGHTGLTVDRSLLLRDHIAEAVIRLTGLSPCSKFPTSHLFPHRKMFE